MTYPIEVLKEKLGEELIRMSLLNKAMLDQPTERLYSNHDSFSLAYKRVSELEKALELLEKETK